MISGISLEKAENQHLFEYPDYLDSAAGLNSDIVDMERFAILLTRGKLLPPSELDRMWEAAKNRAGTIINIGEEMKVPGILAPTPGWFYADNSGGKYPRAFMTRGSATSILVFPKQRLCLIVLSKLQAKDDPLPNRRGNCKVISSKSATDVLSNGGTE